jgi:hypothetical protein
MRIQQAAKQWPAETLSRSEILRRYVLAGVESLKNIPPDDAARLAREFQASIRVPEPAAAHLGRPSSKANHFPKFFSISLEMICVSARIVPKTKRASCRFFWPKDADTMPMQSVRLLRREPAEV